MYSTYVRLHTQMFLHVYHWNVNDIHTQFYPFGFTHGDDELVGEANSTSVQLSRNFYFYGKTIREVHVHMFD